MTEAAIPSAAMNAQGVDANTTLSGLVTGALGRRGRKGPKGLIEGALGGAGFLRGAALQRCEQLGSKSG